MTADLDALVARLRQLARNLKTWDPSYLQGDVNDLNVAADALRALRATPSEPSELADGIYVCTQCWRFASVPCFCRCVPGNITLVDRTAVRAVRAATARAQEGR